jgi:hypothetical protein
MKKEILIGLILLNVNVMATDIKVNDNNSSKEELNNSKKKVIIDLDEEDAKNEERGGIDDIIRGIIPLGHNDEVTFWGKDVVLISSNIKVYINDIYQDAIEVIDGVFTIKSSQLNDGDTVTVKNKNGNTLVEKKVSK